MEPRRQRDVDEADGGVRLDIPVLLPGVEDARDACVTRLVSLIEARDGVQKVHVVTGPPGNGDAMPGVLCVHYDPERFTLGQIQELANGAGAEITQKFGHVVLSIHAVGAEDEGQRIEEAMRAVPGVTAAVVSLAAQAIRIEYDRDRTNRETIAKSLKDVGAPTPDVQEHDEEHPTAAPKSWYARNKEMAWSFAAGVAAAIGWMLDRGADGTPPAALAAFIVAYFFGARDNVGHLFKDLRRGHFHFNIDLLMVVAAVGAATLGQWFEGALLLFLFSLGHALEHYAMGRARNAIKALAALTPNVATIRRGSETHRVPIGQVSRGDIAIVKPAERIPVDGRVVEGSSAVNQAPITGESAPIEKKVGDEVFAGTVNGEGVLAVEVSAAAGDRTMDRVIKLVAEASTQKAPTQQFTDRFQRLFVPAVLIADVLLIVLPPLLGFLPWSVSFYRGMALLVAASPCALALGTPAAVLAGIAQAARNGVLIKGGAHLEALGMIDVLALDKTGTITRGEPRVTDVVPESPATEEQLLSNAGAVEAASQHPLARAVLYEVERKKISYLAASDVQSVTGKGIRAQVDGSRVEVGTLSMFTEGQTVPASVSATVARLQGEGKSTMIVRRSGGTPEWLGVIAVGDEPREGIVATLDALRAHGMKEIVMLTGDNAGVGNAIGSRVGITDVRAGLLPEDKVNAIREMVSRGRVAMVGDGVNDAPALAHATVGIAMGGAGTAAALETADVALMSDDLSKLPFAIALSRQARRIIRQNLYVSLSVIAVLAAATIGGWARIGPAVVVHEGSTLVVIANALRLLRFSLPPQET